MTSRAQTFAFYHHLIISRSFSFLRSVVSKCRLCRYMLLRVERCLLRPLSRSFVLFFLCQVKMSNFSICGAEKLGFIFSIWPLIWALCRFRLLDARQRFLFHYFTRMCWRLTDALMADLLRDVRPYLRKFPFSFGLVSCTTQTNTGVLFLKFFAPMEREKRRMFWNQVTLLVAHVADEL